jgi:hypothetical protein
LNIVPFLGLFILPPDKIVKVINITDQLPSFINSLVNKELKDKQSKSFEEVLKHVKELVEKTEVTQNFEAYFTMLWYSSLPCSDVKGITSESAGETASLKSCRWKGAEIPCTLIFKKVATDRKDFDEPI